MILILMHTVTLWFIYVFTIQIKQYMNLEPQLPEHGHITDIQYCTGIFKR